MINSIMYSEKKTLLLLCTCTCKIEDSKLSNVIIVIFVCHSEYMLICVLSNIFLAFICRMTDKHIFFAPDKCAQTQKVHAYAYVSVPM